MEMSTMPIHDTESRLKMLQEISLAITSTLDLDSILQILFQKIESLRPYGAITFIRLLDKETGILKTLACSNITEEELRQNVLFLRPSLQNRSQFVPRIHLSLNPGKITVGFQLLNKSPKIIR